MDPSSIFTLLIGLFTIGVLVGIPIVIWRVQKHIDEIEKDEVLK